MEYLLLTLALACGCAFGVLVLRSILRPAQIFWPPPGRHSWQFLTAWSLTIVGALAFAGLTILDRGTGMASSPRFQLIGWILIAGGSVWACWGMLHAGWKNILGLDGPLVKSGPYRWTRNPQYTGWAALSAGLPLALNSALAVYPAFLFLVLFVSTPTLEERSLRHRHGVGYERYRAHVRRF